MKKGILLLFILVVAFSSLKSQVAYYDLNNYNRPELERKIKSYELDARLTNRNTFWEVRRPDLNGDLLFTGVAFSSIFKNDSLTQQIKTIRVVGGVNSGLNNLPIKRFGINANMDFNNQNKKFSSFDSERFLELDIDANFSTLSSISKRSDNPTNVFLRPRIILSPGIFIGKGRIEIVNDLWHAETILSMLMEAGELKVDMISSEELEAFAFEIGKIKNTRNTDFRLELIAEYERLVSYFKLKGWLKEESVRFFAVLRDAWVYESFTTRRSGIENKVGFVPLIDYEILFDRQEGNSENLLYNLGFEYVRNHYSAKSENWQIDKNLEIGLNYSDEIPLLFEEEFRNPSFDDDQNLNIRASYGYDWRYLPNQRTNYTISLFSNFNFYKVFNDDYIREKEVINAGLGIDLFYEKYFSPQLVLTVQSGVRMTAVLSENDDATNINYFRITWDYRMW